MATETLTEADEARRDSTALAARWRAALGASEGSVAVCPTTLTVTIQGWPIMPRLARALARCGIDAQHAEIVVRDNHPECRIRSLSVQGALIRELEKRNAD